MSSRRHRHDCQRERESEISRERRAVSSRGGMWDFAEEENGGESDEYQQKWVSKCGSANIHLHRKKTKKGPTYPHTYHIKSKWDLSPQNMPSRTCQSQRINVGPNGIIDW